MSNLFSTSEQYCVIYDDGSSLVHRGPLTQPPRINVTDGGKIQVGSDFRLDCFVEEDQYVYYTMVWVEPVRVINVRAGNEWIIELLEMTDQLIFVTVKSGKYHFGPITVKQEAVSTQPPCDQRHQRGFRRVCLQSLQLGVQPHSIQVGYRLRC